LFAELDKEEDGVVYTRQLILQLRVLNEDIDTNLVVKNLLDQYDTQSKKDMEQVDLPQFQVGIILLESSYCNSIALHCPYIQAIMAELELAR
jgi:hypothetical protein